jgi:long-chain acyl-CoA synthetase
MREIQFERFAAEPSTRICLIDADERSWSRAEVLRTAMDFARQFGLAGLHSGDTVACIAPNCMEYVAAYLAAVRSGLCFVPINRNLTAGEILYVVEDSGTCLLLVHDSSAHLEANLPRRIRIARLRSIDLEQAPLAWPSERAAVPGSVTFYTSATTGRPKGVRRPGGDTLEALRKVSEFQSSLGIGDGCDEVYLGAGPLYHSGPFENAWVALNRGHKIVLMGKWEAEDCLRKIEKYRVTTSFMVPTMFSRLLRLPAGTRAKYDTSSLKVVPHGGAPCARHVKQQMLDWWGPVLFETYGATEAVGTYVTPADWLARPGTVGKPIPGADILILNENQKAVASGVPGRVYIKSYATAAGFEYLNDPARTRACRHGDYVYVGDIGYLDEDGYLFLCDRQVDMIITGGVNVYSAEVEQILSMHAAVVDCAVIGEPDDDLGERVVAFIQLAPGVDPEEVRAGIADFIQSRLARYKMPKVLRFMPTLPRDPNGKLLKRNLRQALSGNPPQPAQ